MKIVENIRVLYFEIDNALSARQFKANSRGYVRKEAELQKKRQLNDEAYFLYLFSRLEDHIREQSSTLVRDKQNSLTNWRNKTLWDFLPNNKNADGFHLMRRVAILTQKGGLHYNQVSIYYKERNNIAHGSSFSIPINMIDVFNKMKTLFEVLVK